MINIFQAKEIDVLYFREDAENKINFPDIVVDDFQKGIILD